MIESYTSIKEFVFRLNTAPFPQENIFLKVPFMNFTFDFSFENIEDESPALKFEIIMFWNSTIWKILPISIGLKLKGPEVTFEMIKFENYSGERVYY